MLDGSTAGFTMREQAWLLVRGSNLPATARELRDLLAATGQFFERGPVPVRIVEDRVSGSPVARPLTISGVVNAAHDVSQPYRVKETAKGIEEIDITLPDRVAGLYLDMAGNWHLEPLHGITSTPLLAADGSVRAAEGYDRITGHWCANVPDVAALLPAKPTKAQAAAALLVLRNTFATFPFQDADRVQPEGSPVPLADTSKPAKLDESTFLAGLVTAVCRPSLHLAPGLLLRGPAFSGAGAGKGLAARCICTIAYGRAPQAFTGGSTREELEKRIASELMEAAPALLLDNLNGVSLKSDLLASVLTERPARTRLLGKSAMIPLNAAAFIVVTGNGLTISEDLARRFLAVELDAQVEDPETRAFKGDILADVGERRTELLAAVLTVWRWGRQQANLPAGVALGSFGQWASWVRDPLLALNCADPVRRIADAKQGDRRRSDVAELLATWHEHHGGTFLPLARLDDAIRQAADPLGRGRQYVAARVDGLAGTRVGGFTLVKFRPKARWAPAEYSVQRLAAGARPEMPTDPDEEQSSDIDMKPYDALCPMAPAEPEKIASGQMGGTRDHVPTGGKGATASFRAIATRSPGASIWDPLPRAPVEPALVESLVRLGELERRIRTERNREVLEIRNRPG